MNKLPKLSESELKNIEYWLRYPQSYIYDDGYLVDIKAHPLNVLLEHYKHNTKPPEKKITLKEYFEKTTYLPIGNTVKIKGPFGLEYILFLRPSESFVFELKTQRICSVKNNLTDTSDIDDKRNFILNYFTKKCQIYCDGKYLPFVQEKTISIGTQIMLNRNDDPNQKSACILSSPDYQKESRVALISLETGKQWGYSINVKDNKKITQNELVGLVSYADIMESEISVLKS